MHEPTLPFAIPEPLDPESRRYSADEIADELGLHRPTEEQRAVIEAPPRPLLVVAGAGSGKTETMASRVVWLVANGHAAPEEVLGLTFTRKAAGELAERIGRRLRRLTQAGLRPPHSEGAAAVDAEFAVGLGDIPTVSTYHAYAGRLVREHGLRLGVEPESRMLSEAAAWQVAHEAVIAYDTIIGDLAGPAESTVTAAVVHLAGELAEHVRTPEEVLAYVDELALALDALPSAGRTTGLGTQGKVLREQLDRRRHLVALVERYGELKRQRSSLDFADQMAIAARLAERFPVIGAIERQRYRAVLLDEFQDTSEAQLVLLEKVFVAAGEPVLVTAVGDPHQSIYGWRGASATTLASFREKFVDAQGPAQVLPLSTSWRNDVAVLAAANQVAAPLRTEGVSAVPVTPLSARPDAGPGSVHAQRWETIEDEARAVADWIRTRWFDDHGRATGVTAAVLCRKRAQFPAVAEALAEAGLPVEVVGIGGLLTTPEVNDIVSLLWAVQDPSRGDRIMRLLTGPALRLGPADIDGLGAWSRARFKELSPETDRDRDIAGASRDEASIVEALEDLPTRDWVGPAGEYLSENARHRLGSLAAVLRDLRTLAALPLPDLVHEAERALGLDIEVLARPEHTAASARVHLDAFADVAAQFAATADRATLGGFLDWLDAAEKEERGLDLGYLEVDTHAVQVLTVHAAKGLEWDLVAVPGLVEGSFPNHTLRPSFSAEQAVWRLGSTGGADPATWELNDNGWITSMESLPYDLRGDRDGLPELRWRAAHDRAEFQKAVTAFRKTAGQHAVAEERRLAYVALTRARESLLLTAPVWADGQTPRLTSRFLLELLQAAVVTQGEWAPMPTAHEADDPGNPRLLNELRQVWPHDPLQRRRAQLAQGAAAVRAALAGPDDHPAPEQPDEIFMLLAEQAQARRRHDPVVQVPRHLSASAVVSLARDPQAFASTLRRPMPQPPALAARRGVAFHSWIEAHYAQAALVDVTELPGSGDENPADDADLPVLKEHFLASPWATRQPLALEVAVETVVDGIALRGRIDAIFRASADDGAQPSAHPPGPQEVTLVDWKTGSAPRGDLAAARVMQLATYRIGYARLHGLRLDQVRAGFFYAATGETVWPSLPDEDEVIALLRVIPE